MALTMRVIGTGGQGPRLGPTPYQYEVLGLDDGQWAWIVNIDHRWRILRTTDGKQGEWSGEFATADAALRHLANM
jgi:hypothetical protein